MAVIKNAVSAMENQMMEEQVHRARLTAEREILSIRLADLRERQGIKQSDLKAFTQSAVSKFEKRKDMKISTLIEYLEDIGMGLEIRAYPKSKESNVKAETLLRI
jgi:hypothetical protein